MPITHKWVGVRATAVVAIGISPLRCNGRIARPEGMRRRSGAAVNCGGADCSADADFPLQQGAERARERAELIGLLKHREAVASAVLLAVAGGQQDRQLG